MLPPQHSPLELQDAPLCLQFELAVVPPPPLPPLGVVATGGLHVATGRLKPPFDGPRSVSRPATLQLDTGVSGAVQDVGAFAPE